MKQAFINGVILDGTAEMTPIPDQIVLTNGEIIEKIADKDTDLTGYTLIDLQGGYLMPGLINMHVHLPGGGKPQKKQQDTKKLVKLMTSTAFLRKLTEKICAGYAKTELYSGVTTLRTMGGVLDMDSKVRDKIYAGVYDGPRILAADMAVSVPNGHMAGSLAFVAHSAEEARDFVRQIAAQKPDLIKLMITGGVLDATVKGEPGVLRMPPEYVKAACEEAHKQGFQVAAHVESPEGVRVALKNGVDTIEHGAKPDEEIIRLFKETGAGHIATLSPALPYAEFDRTVSHIDEMAQYNGEVVFHGVIDCAKACLANGIPVGLGTDTGCPYVTHYDMWRELHYFRKYCGVTNAFALHTATQVNAQIAGLGDVTGSIAVGKCADFVVTKDNPLEDLQALRTPMLVVARGKVYHDLKIKKMAAVERELDKFL